MHVTDTKQAPRQPKPPIPVTILTGFLGAGKTTLLNRMLSHSDLADTAVIINEFGEVGLDHLFVAEASDGIIELASGCLCCTIRGELVTTLEDLLRSLDNGRLERLSRVVIETTGVADPGPVLHAIMLHPYLVQRYRLDGVVTVVDAVNGEATIAAHEEARRQVAVADRLVLSKTDLTDAALPPALAATLQHLNPAAHRLFAADEDFAFASLFNTGLYNPRAAEADIAAWLNLESYGADHDHHHDHKSHHHDHDVNRHGAIEAFSFKSDRALAPHEIEAFLDLMRSAYGRKLLRVKGIAKLTDNPDQPLVVHGVQEVFHPPVRLPGWPDGDDHSTRFVFITDGLSQAYVERMFNALTGDIGVDQPDSVALIDNPLAPPGLSVR